MRADARCPHPAVPANAKVALSSSTLVPGTTATYKCDDGYELFGTDTLTCSSDATWPNELPFCGTNVAYRKPSNQSTSTRGGGAGNANDGERTNIHDGHRCSETQKEVAPWWQVDLLRAYAIRAVRITTRGCCGHQPLQDIEIRVGNSTTVSRNPLCAWNPATIEEGVTKVIQCSRTVVGQYVSVQMIGIDGSLSLCEVEVFTADEFSSERCSPASESNHVGIFNQTCYEFQISEGKTFVGAQKYCQEIGGDLVHSLKDSSKNFIVAELERRKKSLKTQLIWIGAQREPVFTSRTWRWVNGDVVNNPNWGKDQPNNYNGEQNCVVLDGGRDWLWNDVGCNLDYLHWICQYRPSSCGSPDKNANTTIVGTNYKVNSSITYECPQGHVLIGDKSRSCLPMGFWSGKAPVCKYVTCGTLKDIDNGAIRMEEGPTFGAVAEYSCNENYTLKGLQKRRCREDGRWEGDDPFCLYSWCEAPPQLLNGLQRSSGQSVGDTVTYSCNAGYILSGKHILSCELGGRWSGDAPFCRFVDCGTPRTPENGSFSLVNGTTSFGSIIEYTCKDDFVLVGPQSRTCKENGKWSGEDSTCSLIECDEPEVPAGSYVTGYSFGVHSVIEYHCEGGHLLRGNPTRHCNREGQWSGEAPSCHFIDCNRVPALPNGIVQYVDDTTYLGSQIRYNCSRNYQLDGSGIRFCLDNGQWSGDSPTCKEIRCPDPDRPANSILSITGNDRNYARTLISSSDNNPSITYKIGSLVKYRCERGFRVDGASLRTCEDSGSWMGQPPTCTYVECGLPDYLPHGRFTLTSNATYYGATVLYECEDHYQLVGHGRRLCLENGTWSSEPPSCQEIFCQEPETFNVTKVTVTSSSIGGLARYSCAKGQSMKGNDTRVCMQNGVWSGQPPICEWVHCDEPFQIENGHTILINQTRSYGSVVAYHCIPGYRRVGPYMRKCMEDGRWSGVVPGCEEDPLGIGDNNSIDGTSNYTDTRTDLVETPVGVGIGVGVGLAIVILVILAVYCLHIRKGTPVKNTENVQGIDKKETQSAEVMSYASLNDNYNHHIYDSVGENVYENTNGAMPTFGHMGNNGRPAVVTINGVAVQ